MRGIMAKPKPPRKTTLTDAQHAALLAKPPPPAETEEQFKERMKKYEKGGSFAVLKPRQPKPEAKK